MSEPCIYKDQIDKLVDSVPRLEEKINNLNTAVASHTVVITRLLEFQSQLNGEAKGKKELEARLLIATELKATQKRDKRQWIFIYAMVAIAAIGLAFTAYFGFKNSKTPEIVRESIDNMEGISKVTRGGYVRYNDQGLSDSVKVK